MTGWSNGNGNGAAVATAAPADLGAVVTALTEQALVLSARSPRHPSLVRVAVGDVVVELHWVVELHGADAAAVPPAGTARPAPPPASPAVPAAPTGAEAGPGPAAGTFPLCSSTVGVLYRSPEPGSPPFVAEGDVVRTGQQVAIIEAMKLMIPLQAERDGRVVEFLVPDAGSVEHGQPVLLLVPLDAAAGGS
jgi:acetyl-CoA carboxylase biotin carboxyl carrier protein